MKEAGQLRENHHIGDSLPSIQGTLAWQGLPWAFHGLSAWLAMRPCEARQGCQIMMSEEPGHVLPGTGGSPPPGIAADSIATVRTTRSGLQTREARRWQLHAKCQGAYRPLAAMPTIDNVMPAKGTPCSWG